MVIIAMSPIQKFLYQPAIWKELEGGGSGETEHLLYLSEQQKPKKIQLVWLMFSGVVLNKLGRIQYGKMNLILAKFMDWL